MPAAGCYIAPQYNGKGLWPLPLVIALCAITVRVSWAPSRGPTVLCSKVVTGKAFGLTLLVIEACGFYNS